MYVIKGFVGHQNTGVECRSTPVQAWAHQYNKLEKNSINYTSISNQII